MTNCRQAIGEALSILERETLDAGTPAAVLILMLDGKDRVWTHGSLSKEMDMRAVGKACQTVFCTSIGEERQKRKGPQ